MNQHSCIYEGHVRHRRFESERHDFRYRLFMMYVDLAEIQSVFDQYWLWSTKRANIAWFRRSDFLDQQPRPLADSVRELVHAESGVMPSGPIRLLTNFRYFGYAINPISLYYCFNECDQIEFVVAEVTNTPWGEKHAYVLDARNQKSLSNIEIWADKKMHVSPFLGMDYRYRFSLGSPAENLSVHIENYSTNGSNPLNCNDANANFDATLTMKRRPLTSKNLSRVLVRYPLTTAQVFAKIHWQAIRLWAKGVAVQPHPAKENAAPNHIGHVMTTSSSSAPSRELASSEFCDPLDAEHEKQTEKIYL